MKNKAMFGSAILLGVIIVLWVAGRVTGMLQYYNIPTPSMEPTLRVKDHILSSNLLTPHLNDIICFNKMSGETNTTYVSRLVGLPEQMFQVKNGLVYINGELTDDSTKLYREYIMPAKAYYQYNNKLSESNVPYGENEGKVILRLSQAELSIFSNEDKPSLQYAAPGTVGSDFLAAHQEWSLDNIGPFKIPADSCFVMGDSRYNCLDSRYYGFVPVKDIKGVVLNRK